MRQTRMLSAVCRLGTVAAVLMLATDHPAEAQLGDVTIEMVGVLMQRVEEPLGGFVEFSLVGQNLTDARFLHPTRGWIAMNYEEEDEEWNWDARVSTEAELFETFPTGLYRFAFTFQGQPWTTDVTVTQASSMPTSFPRSVTPTFGRSDVSPGTVSLSWQPPPPDSVDLIRVEVERRFGDPFFNTLLPPTASTLVIYNVPADTLFEGGIYFGRVQSGNTAEGAEYFVARATGARLLFSTLTNRALLAHLVNASFEHGVENGTGDVFRVHLDFDIPLRPSQGSPPYQSMFLEMPDSRDPEIFSVWNYPVGDQRTIDFEYRGGEDLPFPMPWIYALLVQVDQSRSFCTTFDLSSAGIGPLTMPAEDPILVRPSYGAVTTKQVSAEWNAATDTNIVGIYSRIAGNETNLPRAATSFGPVNVPPGQHHAIVAFWNKSSTRTNADGVAYDAYKWRARVHPFEARHRIVYRAGAGGVISGVGTQLIAHGANALAVTATPAQSGAVFRIWSDGKSSAQRAESNVVADAEFQASFMSVSGADLDWYAARGIFPAPGESWLDVDLRPVPQKGTMLREENIADTDPTNPQDLFRISSVQVATNSSGIRLSRGSTNRFYQLIATDDLRSGQWVPVPGAGPRRGSGGPEVFTDPSPTESRRVYGLRVFLDP